MKKYYVWMTALLLLWLVLTCVFLILAPDQVPVHFDINGNVDRMGSKYEYLLLPGLGLFAMFASILGTKKSTNGNEKTVAIMTICLLAFMTVLFSYFMWKALDPNTVQVGLDRLALRGTMLFLMVFFIVLGNITPKVQRNSFMGLRTKWSMYNDTCWQKSQRLCGYTMMLCGLLGLLLCAVVPDAWVIWACLGLIFIMLSVAVVGSYLIYKKERNKEAK